MVEVVACEGSVEIDLPVFLLRGGPFRPTKFVLQNSIVGFAIEDCSGLSFAAPGSYVKEKA